MTGSNLDDCSSCKACELASTRQSVVISRGNPNANLMLIGEAPGAQEDAQGVPFVGRSGRALRGFVWPIFYEYFSIFEGRFRAPRQSTEVKIYRDISIKFSKNTKQRKSLFTLHSFPAQ